MGMGQTVSWRARPESQELGPVTSADTGMTFITNSPTLAMLSDVNGLDHSLTVLMFLFHA